MNSKRIWATTNTGWKFHAFEGGSARCRKNILPRRVSVHGGFYTLTYVQERFASAEVCPKCLAAVRMDEQAFRSTLDRLHAEALEMNEALDAQTAEEDCICPVRTDYHSLDCQTFRRAHTTTEETNDMADEARDYEGPLSPLQARILKHLTEGDTHEEVGEKVGRAKGHVTAIVRAIVRKMDCRKSSEAIARYAASEAYLAAAEKIELDRPTDPRGDEVDEHVHHVMTSLAEDLRSRARNLLPK